MPGSLIQKIPRIAARLPNLLQGYNLYVNRDKLRLIDHVFTAWVPQGTSFADLGGVWKVNGAYSRYTTRLPSIRRGVLVDTDFPPAIERRLAGVPKLQLIHGDFSRHDIIARLGQVDVVYFFDVLLHQANPDWNEVLSAYVPVSRCFVIYNQQYVLGEDTIRLTDLPLARYIELASDARADVYRYIYEHKTELHPAYGKPWGDIHNITQWGISDRDLRTTMATLGYREVYYHNFGRFVDLPAFENHAFIFLRP